MSRGRRIALIALLAALVQCTNDPYRSTERGQNVYYSSFPGTPKHLDPARSYSSDEYLYIQQIYEPPIQYHFLKRPYELIPLTATEIPQPEYFDKDGNPLNADPPAEQVARAVYTVRLHPGIQYESHPCFAPNSTLSPSDVANIESVDELPRKGTRELVAADYVWQIKRLANPALECPIFSLLANYIDGLEELSSRLQQELDRVREQRRKESGALYSREADERDRPIFIDLDPFDFPGAKVVDPHTYQIVLKRKYPQMRYWLAMPFFSPMPKEAERFFAQGPLAARNFTLDRSPVGTGAFRMSKYDPNREIVLVRNKNYRGEAYPVEGEAGDREAGLLADAEKKLPFIDRAVYKLEKEEIPRWSKFQQGYYDASVIISDVYDQAVKIGSAGKLGLTETMEERGVQLVTEVSPTVWYMAFNMLDPEVGGYAPEKRKLRQAISIALDQEEFIEIFENGRGIPCHGPVPPGIFGHLPGKEGMNPFVYDWDTSRRAPRRKSIEAARLLLSEAGYPGGRRKDGTPLTVYYDTSSSGAEAKPQQDWMRKQAARIGIDLQIRATDYNRFQEKARTGNFQLLPWGWIADYPDPENFLMLLYGPNGKKEFGGENAANYDNAEYNKLFKQMESMGNIPERAAFIGRMNHMVQQDAPWIPQFFPVEFTLYHKWYYNTKAMTIGANTLKYRRVNPRTRDQLRAEWNSPVVWPVVLLVILALVSLLPGVAAIRGRRQRSALS